MITSADLFTSHFVRSHILSLAENTRLCLNKNTKIDIVPENARRVVCSHCMCAQVCYPALVKRLKGRMKEYESDNQYGFKVKSTVKEAEEKYVLGIFVNFKRAFDNLEWRVLLKRLREIGF